MEISIRPLMDEDLDEVCRIEEEAFSMPWKKKDFKQLIDEDISSYLVICVDGKVIGTAGYTDQVGEGYVNNVVIDKPFRGQGYAHRLMEAVIEDAAGKGITDLTLEVRVSNEAAFSLYQSLGFENAGIRKRFYEHPVEDAYVMWKH